MTSRGCKISCNMRWLKTTAISNTIIRLPCCSPFQSNKTVNVRANQALADLTNIRKCRAREKHFQWLGYDFLLSCYSYSSEDGVRRKAKQHGDVKQGLLKCRSQIWLITFWCWREWRILTCLLFGRNEIGFARETNWCWKEPIWRNSPRLVGWARGGASAAIWQWCCRRCALYILDYTQSTSDATAVKVIAAQLACLDAWIATIVTCLTERESRQEHWQKL